MNKLLKPFLLFLVMAALLQCSSKSTDPEKPDKPRDLTVVEKSLTESGNKFAFNLFNKMSESSNGKNLFISPLSVSFALGMAYNGASGDTRDSIGKTLGFMGLTVEQINSSYKSLMGLLTGLDSKVIMQIANSIWYRQGFSVKDEFLKLNKDYFSAEVAPLDFDDPGAANTINEWVSENTKGRIKEIVEEPINPLMMLYLINAIYFKGTWTYQFDESKTIDDQFIGGDGSPISCKMMSQKGDYLYFENQELQAVDLPYGDGKFNMAIFVPTYGSDINTLAARFTQENWNSWTAAFTEQTVNLYMPRFKVEAEYTLNQALSALGIEIAFDPYAADFSNICDTIDLHITEVKHKSLVEVNEEGTEAAAVTIVGIGTTSMPVEVTVRLDRPFIFIIHENHSNSILFMGILMKP